MVNSESPTPMPPPDFYANLTALGVKVTALDSDVGEINDRLLGLDTKIDKAVASLAHEFRTALAALSGQLSERNKTPWAVLISAAGFVVAILGLFGSQALAPLQADIKSLRADIVPRSESSVRAELNSRRIDDVEQSVRLNDQRRYDEMVRELERLRDLTTKP